MSFTADQEKHQYHEYWGYHAEHFHNQNCYDWMASQLDDIKPKRIFDVGCGTGEGLLALRKRFAPSILSIDENVYCIKKSAALLRSEHAQVQIQERHVYLDDGNGRHILGIKPDPIKLSREVMLVQADMLLPDETFFKFLESKAPFDAVTVWLIGAYEGRKSCKNLDPMKIQDVGDYRLRVQNKTYEIASEILRSGGLLQVVDRGELPKTEHLVQDIISSHKAQASVTDLEFQDLKFIPYAEHTTGKGIRMVATPGTSGRKAQTDELAMISVISRKP